MNQKYLNETKLLDFNSFKIQKLVAERGWKDLPEKGRIGSIYNYVRDEIKFGYNVDDAIPASKVLSDGYGQCNTKGILFMAILRSVGIPCRMHGFTINKELQKGAITGIWYKLSPVEITHSWVEILYKNKWLNIEGFILDSAYLKRLQIKYKDCTGSFCGFGVATKNFQNPDIYWDEKDTYIQKEGIKQDFGIFDDPDSFLSRHGQQLSVLKRLLYRYLVRHLMNRNVDKIRKFNQLGTI